jgi:hypothetical protein
MKGSGRYVLEADIPKFAWKTTKKTYWPVFESGITRSSTASQNWSVPSQELSTASQLSVHISRTQFSWTYYS